MQCYCVSEKVPECWISCELKMPATIPQLRRTILRIDYRKSSPDLLSSPLCEEMHLIRIKDSAQNLRRSWRETSKGKDILHQIKQALWGREVLKSGLSEPAAAAQVTCLMFWGVQAEQNKFSLRVKCWIELLTVCKIMRCSLHLPATRILYPGESSQCE